MDAQIKALLTTYAGSRVQEAVQARVAELTATPGPAYEASTEQPGWAYQTTVLTWRTFLNNLRNVSVFWLRLAMYVLLCLGVAFVYFQLGDSWKDVYSRAALLFFVVAFLTFMSVAAFPAFVEDMKIFLRERLNGYYGVSQFTVANTLASLPFIFLIAVVSTVTLYWIVGLNSAGGAVIYFILDLFLSLVVVESIMMAIAPIVPNFLMGIAAGAGLLGFYMIVCGFFQPVRLRCRSCVATSNNPFQGPEIPDAEARLLPPARSWTRCQSPSSATRSAIWRTIRFPSPAS